MQFGTWVRKSLDRNPLRPRLTLRLEALEERSVPATLLVNTVADNTTADGFLTLREAVQLVNAGGNAQTALGRTLTAQETAQITTPPAWGTNDTITFSAAARGTINLVGTPQLPQQLELRRSVSVQGPGASLLAVSINSSVANFYVFAGTTVGISGLTIARGPQGWGGIRNSGTLTVSNSTVRGTFGSGIFSTGTLTVNDSTFSDNIVTGYGGGIHNLGTLTVNRSTFSGNRASITGGAIYSLGGLTVTDSTFSGNRADSEGGGIYLESGNGTVTRSTFSGNTGFLFAGGILNLGTLTVSQSTLANNIATSLGGGIYNRGSLTVNQSTLAGNFAANESGGIHNVGTLVLNHSTLSDNRTNGQGGGLVHNSGTATMNHSTISGNFAGSLAGGLVSTASMTLTNTIVARNFGTPANFSNIAGTVTGSYNLIGTGSSGGLVNGQNGNQVGVADPGVDTTLRNNGGPTQTLALLPCSPAIRAGTGNAATDQRGVARLSSPSIGAYEYTVVATRFVVSGFPSPATAGTPGTVTVRAVDAQNNTVTGHCGTVRLTSSDPQAVLPANYTFTPADNGVRQFSVTLRTAGARSFTATDTVTATITGTQTGIVVNPAATSRFAVSGFPGAVTAGVVGNVTVTAQDAFGNTTSAYRGTVRFTSTDPQAALPANYTFTAADNGVRQFGATLRTVGSRSLTATDTANGALTGTQTGIVVNPAATSRFAVSGFPGAVTAGVAGNIMVTAQDAFGNTTSAYRGTTRFTSDDPQALLPANYTFTAADNGVRQFSVTLQTAGNWSVTATDTATTTITGSQVGIAVNPAAASLLVLSDLPKSLPAGTPASVTATLYDPYGNVATGYRGTVRFTSSDPAAALPADYTFTAEDNGVATFPDAVALSTAGNQTVAAADTEDGALAGEAVLTVTPGPVAFYYLYPDTGTVIAGQAFDLYVFAFDQFGNPIVDYTGEVLFWSTDEAAVLPKPYTFQPEDGGVAYFFEGVTLFTLGQQELYAFDTETYTAIGYSLLEVEQPGGAPGPGTGLPLWADLIATLLEAKTQQVPAFPLGGLDLHAWPTRRGG